MNANALRAAIVAAFATVALAACQQQAGDRTVGQKIDKALETSKEKLAAAGEKTREKLAEVGDQTRKELSEASDKTQQKLAEVGAKTEQAASQATGGRDAGEVVNDTAITASIKTDYLKDPDLSVLKIDVDTKSGVVTLNGLTPDEAARQRAEKMASAVKGVKEVRNFLVVKRA